MVTTQSYVPTLQSGDNNPSFHIPNLRKRPDNLCDVVVCLLNDPHYKLPERYSCNGSAQDLWVPAPQNVIPIIDLSCMSCELNSECFATLAAQIGKAIVEWGGFQIVNHGIPDSVITSMHLIGTNFFNLPVNQKERILTKNKLGYDGRFDQAHSLYHNTRVSWMEYLAQTTIVSEVEAIRKTIWPSEEDPAGQAFSEAIISYNKGMQEIKIKLLQLFALDLELPVDFFSQHFEDEAKHYSTWRFKRYPPRCRQPSVSGGLSHTDPYMLAIINQDEVGGLSTYHTNSRCWHSVNPIPNAFVVIVGDLLEAWTNSKYKSQVHRVCLTEDSWRLSIIYAFSSPNGLLISAPAELVSKEHPRLHRPFSWSEFITEIRAAPETYRANGARFRNSLNLVALHSEVPLILKI